MAPESSRENAFRERFQAYFQRDVAQSAAGSLSDGSEIEFQIQTRPEGESQPQKEIFTFTRVAGKNQILSGPARDPQILFILPPHAAEAILSDPSDSIGTIGVNILKLLVSSDASRRVTIAVRAGFLTLFTKGYFGVVTAGGSDFAAYLASIGLNGMGAIKAALTQGFKSDR